MSHNHNEKHYLNCVPCRDRRETRGNELVMKVFGTKYTPRTENTAEMAIE